MSSGQYSDMQTSDEWAPVTPRESRITNIPGSWHNPTGQTLRKLHPDLWVIERGYVDYGMDVGGKGTIIRLPGRRLFAYSVLPLTPELKALIDELGSVSVVVAGNTQHVDYVANWKKHYPRAIYLAPPGFMAARSDVPFDAELSVDGSPHESYKDDAHLIGQVYIDSVPIMSETVFFHFPSKSLLVTDLIFTYPKEGLPLATRIAKFVLGNVFANVHLWFLVKDRAAFRNSVKKIESFEFQTIIPCHGEIITNDAAGVFKRWLRQE